jgi:hypothetical protein
MPTARPSFFLDAISARSEAGEVMRRFVIAVTPGLLLVGVACAPEPEPPNAFMTVGSSGMTQTTTVSDTGDSADTNIPEDMPSSGDGDADAGDGDGDNTTNGDGDGDNTTNGDGDADPSDSGDPVCGNGVIDDGEQCDGGNLGGFTCVDLGYSGGSLGCDPVTCTYDASVTDGGTSGGTSG